MYTQNRSINSGRSSSKRNSYQTLKHSARNQDQTLKNFTHNLPQVKIDLKDDDHFGTASANLYLNSSKRNKNTTQALRDQIEYLKIENSNLKQEIHQFKINIELLQRQNSILKQQKIDQSAQQQHLRVQAQDTILKYHKKIKQLYEQLIQEKRKNLQTTLTKTSSKYKAHQLPSTTINTIQQIPFDLNFWKKIQQQGEKAYISSISKSNKFPKMYNLDDRNINTCYDAEFTNSIENVTQSDREQDKYSQQRYI